MIRNIKGKSFVFSSLFIRISLNFRLLFFNSFHKRIIWQWNRSEIGWMEKNLKKRSSIHVRILVFERIQCVRCTNIWWQKRVKIQFNCKMSPMTVESKPLPSFSIVFAFRKYCLLFLFFAHLLLPMSIESHSPAESNK